MTDQKLEANLKITRPRPRKGEPDTGELAGTLSIHGDAAALLRRAVDAPTAVSLQRTKPRLTDDLPLWVLIRRSTEAISFERYSTFMDLLLCGIDRMPESDRKGNTRKEFDMLRERRFLPFNDTDAYRLLKVATEAFLVANCGVDLGSSDTGDPLTKFLTGDATDAGDRIDASITSDQLNSFWKGYLKRINGVSDTTIPYLALVREKLKDSPLKSSIFAKEDGEAFPEECVGILRRKLLNPCFLELIWSYWHEEGMLVQTLNTISLRFQNVRGPAGDRDPLRLVEIDPLRPLNNLLWGYVQDEQHRLSMARRVCEYDHHYGLRLIGKAVPVLNTADTRSRFIEAFHNLLFLCSVFYKEDDDTTVIADGFPLLNALKDVHLLLAEGAHNQFGDLPSTARQEMLAQQWLLARPEFREFLPSRVMVAYPEPWMDRVDTMKSLQGWTDVSSIHFRNLAAFGEQIVLSIRFGAWSKVDERDRAANWARYWRSEIQGYIHAYRAATGVDLTIEATMPRQAEERSMLPSALLRNRLLTAQRQRGVSLQLPATVRTRK